MQIVEVLIYVLLIAGLTIYIHFEKRDSYQKGFSDGVEHYSKLVDEVLYQTNRWNKKAEEAGTGLTAYVESIRPLNKSESEEEE